MELIYDKQANMDPQVILERFKNDLKPLYFGNDNILLDNYLTCIERVFGEDEAERHEKDF